MPPLPAKRDLSAPGLPELSRQRRVAGVGSGRKPVGGVNRSLVEPGRPADRLGRRPGHEQLRNPALRIEGHTVKLAGADIDASEPRWGQPQQPPPAWTTLSNRPPTADSSGAAEQTPVSGRASSSLRAPSSSPVSAQAIERTCS